MLNILEGYDLGERHSQWPGAPPSGDGGQKGRFQRPATCLLPIPSSSPSPSINCSQKKYSETIRRNISRDLAKAPPSPLPYKRPTDTVYLTAVDKDRNAVSFISSIFQHFGSGIVVDGTGIILHNRGRSFSLDHRHFNRLEPRKRPMHTIIPAMLFKDGKFVMSFGVVGADMQPQGQVQFLLNLIDFKMNLQEAMDAPRARHLEGLEIYLEEGVPEETRSSLRSKGHRLTEEKARHQSGRRRPGNLVRSRQGCLAWRV